MHRVCTSLVFNVQPLTEISLMYVKSGHIRQHP